MDYTSTEMPSPKSSFFKISYTWESAGANNELCLCEMIDWVREYKPTLLYGFKCDKQTSYHYLAVSEEKSVANLTSLIKNAMTSPPTVLTIETFKTKEEFMKVVEDTSCKRVKIVFPFPKPAEETTSISEEQNGDFSINIKMSDYTIIDSTPAVPLGIYDKFEEQIKTMKEPIYILKAFDIKIPFDNNANGDFPIPRYLFMTLSGISVSSGDFRFEINGCLRGKSTNGHLDLTLTPGNKDATSGELHQEICSRTGEDRMVQEAFKDVAGQPKYPMGTWLNDKNVFLTMLKGLEPNTTITFHCVRFFLQDKQGNHKNVSIGDLVKLVC
jgi:hypothetical protein